MSEGMSILIGRSAKVDANAWLVIIDSHVPERVSASYISRR